MKRSRIKYKKKRFPTPKEELAKVDERSGGQCEYCRDRNTTDILDYAHFVHRGMGGVQKERAKVINDHRNIVRLYRYHHRAIDGNIKFMYGENFIIIDILKKKIKWYEWAEENRGVLNR